MRNKRRSILLKYNVSKMCTRCESIQHQKTWRTIATNHTIASVPFPTPLPPSQLKNQLEHHISSTLQMVCNGVITEASEWRWNNFTQRKWFAYIPSSPILQLCPVNDSVNYPYSLLPKSVNYLRHDCAC